MHDTTEPRAGRISSGILKRISRRTTTGSFVPEMDGLRFVAIFWVVFFHIAVLHRPETPTPLRILSGSGHYGVELFFIISGFVLALPFAVWRMQGGSAVELKRYYLRRVTRLEPPYLLSLLAYFSLKVLVKGESLSELLPHLFASGSYLHNVIYAERSTISVVAWSLEIEVQFYLLAPVLGRVFLIADATRRRLVLFSLIGACMLLCVIFDRSDHPRLFLSLPAYLHYFLIGFLLADGYLSNGWRTRHGGSELFDLIGVVSLALLAPSIYYGYHGALGQLTGPVLCGLFAFSAFHGKLLNRFFRNPWIYSFGGMCYTIYLYHSIIVQSAGSLVARVLGDEAVAPRIYADIILSVGLVSIVCPIIFIATERPFMQPDWLSRVRRALFRGVT